MSKPTPADLRYNAHLPCPVCGAKMVYTVVRHKIANGGITVSSQCSNADECEHGAEEFYTTEEFDEMERAAELMDREEV